jgi:hypothetical protein
VGIWVTGTWHSQHFGTPPPAPTKWLERTNRPSLSFLFFSFLPPQENNKKEFNNGGKSKQKMKEL